MNLTLLLLLCPLQGGRDVAQTVVTAPRAEVAEQRSSALVSVIEGEQLVATGERSLPRALARATGVWVQETNMGGGAPVVNGMIGNRILIVVDGVRLNDSTTRNGPNQLLNGIDPLSVERIELLRGPSSVLYGSDAIGGVILITTKRRLPAGPGSDALAQALRADVDLEYGTAASGGRASITPSGATEDLGWLGVFSYQDYDDLENGDGVEQPSGYSGAAEFGSVDWALGDRRGLRFTALESRDVDIPRTDRLMVGFGQTQPASEVWNYALQHRRRFALTYTDDSGAGLADRMEARVSLRTYREERERRDTGSITTRNERDYTETVGVGVDWKKTLGEDHLLTWGFDIDNDQVDSKRVDVTGGSGVTKEGAFADGSRYTSGGVFLRDEIFNFDPVIVTAGVRYSHFDFAFQDFASNGGGREEGDFGAVTASVEATRPLGEGLQLTGILAQGFRAPNLDDLANDGSFASGSELANPDLDPEESLTAQLALDLARPTWTGSFGVWFMAIEDLIGRELVSAGLPPPGDEVYMRENVGRAEVFGADLIGDFTLGDVGSPWSVGGRITYTYGTQFGDNIDPSDPTVDETPFRRIPPLHGLVELRWEQPRERRWLDHAGLSFLWATEQDRLHPEDIGDPRIDPNGTEGWTRLDFDVGGPIGRVGRTGAGTSWWSAGLWNLFDEQYRVHASGLDAPGRQLVVGLHLSF